MSSNSLRALVFGFVEDSYPKREEEASDASSCHPRQDVNAPSYTHSGIHLVNDLVVVVVFTLRTLYKEREKLYSKTVFSRSRVIGDCPKREVDGRELPFRFGLKSLRRESATRTAVTPNEIPTSEIDQERVAILRLLGLSRISHVSCDLDRVDSPWVSIQISRERHGIERDPLSRGY